MVRHMDVQLMELSMRTLVLLALLPSCQATTTLYVTSSAHSGGGNGSLSDPYTSLQSCADELASLPAGSSCLLLNGTYRLNATVAVRNVHGESDAPSVIAAAPGASPLLDGTLHVPGPWTWHAATHTFTDGTTQDVSHWVALWPDDGRADPWQLFVDD